MYIEGKYWYFTIYTNRKHKQKINWLIRLKNEIVWFICKLKSKNVYDYKLFKYYTNCYYTKSYKTLVYVFGYGKE